MPPQKFSAKELEHAVNRLKLMKFFPADPAAWSALAELLAKMCPHREALEWLVTTLQNRVSEWPGAQEVRGLLCTRYDAADGIDAWCSLAGFTAADYEAKHYERHTQLTGKSPGYEGALDTALTSMLPPHQLAAATTGCRDVGSYIADEVMAENIRQLAAAKTLSAAARKAPNSESGNGGPRWAKADH